MPPNPKTPARRRAEKKFRGDQQVCSYGYCLAPVAGRQGSPYCSDEHAALAKNRHTLESRAEQVAVDYMEAVAIGNVDAPPHRGWLTTADFVVLSGEVVIELKAAVAPVAVAATKADDIAAVIPNPDLVASYSRAVYDVNHLINVLDTVLSNTTGPRS